MEGPLEKYRSGHLILSLAGIGRPRNPFVPGSYKTNRTIPWNLRRVCAINYRNQGGRAMLSCFVVFRWVTVHIWVV
jgi:hypothetical protein